MNIRVKGMHCNACKTLIRMEFDEHGFGENVQSIELKDNNIGVITLDNVSQSDIDRIRTIINSTDQYQVI